VTKPKRRGYSPEAKAAAMAALLSGQGVSEVAATYQIPAGTVKAWLSRRKHAKDVATVAPDKRSQIGDLLVDYLHANLAALRSQLVVFTDPAWLSKQDADAAAVLHGVMTDKAIRLLEALGAAGDRAR
jgi:transposase-like protein